jgi:sugar transferase (PEP-CTERM system associated)
MLRVFKQYYPIRNIFFILGEGLFIFASVLIASWIVIGYNSFIIDEWLWFKALLIAIFCFMGLYYNDLYDLKVTDSLSELTIRLFQALGGTAIFLAIIYFLFPQLIIGKGIFMISIAFTILFIVSWRIAYTIVLNKGLFNQKIIIVGSGRLAKNIIDEIKLKKDCGYSIEVILSECKYKNSLIGNDIEVQCNDTIAQNGYRGLCDIGNNLEIDKIVMAIEEKRGNFPVEELLRCRVGGIEVLEGVAFYEMLTGKLIVEQINPAWLIFSEGFQKSWARRFLKRIVDIVLSSIMLVMLMPLIFLIALMIKLESKGPFIFSQERMGQNRTSYQVYKFRSMIHDAEAKTGPVWAEDDDQRITRVGKLIRKLRLDELPQLWNVLKGDMSFVGPRPEREYFVEQLEKVIPYFRERFTVKPGISGWAQVSYGYGDSVEDAIEKLNYDLFYIKNMSIFMDIMIILRTVKIVLFAKGAR